MLSVTILRPPAGPLAEPDELVLRFPLLGEPNGGLMLKDGLRSRSLVKTFGCLVPVASRSPELVLGRDLLGDEAVLLPKDDAK